MRRPCGRSPLGACFCGEGALCFYPETAFCLGSTGDSPHTQEHCDVAPPGSSAVLGSVPGLPFCMSPVLLVTLCRLGEVLPPACNPAWPASLTARGGQAHSSASMILRTRISGQGCITQDSGVPWRQFSLKIVPSASTPCPAAGRPAWGTRGTDKLSKLPPFGISRLDSGNSRRHHAVHDVQRESAECKQQMSLRLGPASSPPDRHAGAAAAEGSAGSRPGQEHGELPPHARPFPGRLHRAAHRHEVSVRAGLEGGWPGGPQDIRGRLQGGSTRERDTTLEKWIAQFYCDSG